MLRLVIDCDDQIRYFPLSSEAELSLGSAEDNDICVPFAGVSRRHAQLRRVEEGVLLSDAGSKNGIVDLDGARHSELLLVPGGSVRIGRALVALEEVSTSDVELALALDLGARVARRGMQNESETAEGEGPHDGGSPREALRLVRELEALGPAVSAVRSARVLERARRVLDADSLLLVSVRPGVGLVVTAHSGRAQRDELLELVETRLLTDPAARGTSKVPEGDARAFLYWRRNGPRALVAALEGASVDSWRQDFLDYLASRLCGPDASPSERAEIPDPPAPDPVLVVPEGMVLGSAESMAGLLRHLRITVKSDLDVLLVGETGTGKELFAKMIHQSGPTASGPFVPVNCAAIPNELLEAELFGVLPGAATGVEARPGLFLKASGGTIFLDEITEMADRLHAKLLRVLQEREVLPVGGSSARRIKVRVISACNRDLAALVRAGQFRADLFYRLRGLQFHIPPLRERLEDLPDLVMAFVERAAKKHGKRISGVSRKALRLLRQHDWPGNVRELETEVVRAVLLCPAGAALESDHFATVKWELAHRAAAVAPPGAGAPAETEVEEQGREQGGELQAKLDHVEREAIVAALTRAGGNKTKAAAFLGVTRNGLRIKMMRLGIRWPQQTR